MSENNMINEASFQLSATHMIQNLSEKTNQFDSLNMLPVCLKTWQVHVICLLHRFDHACILNEIRCSKFWSFLAVICSVFNDIKLSRCWHNLYRLTVSHGDSCKEKPLAWLGFVHLSLKMWITHLFDFGLHSLIVGNPSISLLRWALVLQCFGGR